MISFYRYKGASDIPNIDDVVRLCRQTGRTSHSSTSRPNLSRWVTGIFWDHPRPNASLRKC